MPIRCIVFQSVSQHGREADPAFQEASTCLHAQCSSALQAKMMLCHSLVTQVQQSYRRVQPVRQPAIACMHSQARYGMQVSARHRTASHYMDIMLVLPAKVSNIQSTPDRLQQQCCTIKSTLGSLQNNSPHGEDIINNTGEVSTHNLSIQLVHCDVNHAKLKSVNQSLYRSNSAAVCPGLIADLRLIKRSRILGSACDVDRLHTQCDTIYSS